jgi:ubiquinone/menaquinone biosynthesis C-methylase UbiE
VIHSRRESWGRSVSAAVSIPGFDVVVTDPRLDVGPVGASATGTGSILLQGYSMASSDKSAILASEREFHDAEASALTDDQLLIPRDQVERYRNARASARSIPKDVWFSKLNPLQGKKVLDYGCGTGDNACLLALCGAEVTAFDLSPVCVEKARRRAEINGVGGRIDFHVRAAGDTKFPDNSFDAIVGTKILHHLHTELPHIYGELHRLLVPGGMAAFVEPVANSPTLRFLRRFSPVGSEITPDERQMIYSDFDGMRSLFTDIEFRYFYNLARLAQVFGGWFYPPANVVDHYALRALPFLKRYYGTVLVTARRPR